MVKIMTHLHMQWYESLCNKTYMLNYLLCADMHICTWCLNHKQKYKIELWLAKLKNTKNLPNMCSLSKGQLIPFFFFFCIPTHSDFVVYNLTVGRSDLLPLQKFSVCARGAGWWGLSTAEGVTALYLQYVFSQHDVTSSLSLICSFVGFDTLSCETVDR